MIRMLLLGFCQGIRSERRLCEEVHVNLAYKWFCRLDLTDPVPDHSTFSKNRHGRFGQSGLFRHLFETVLQRYIDEGLVGGESFGVDACPLKPQCCPGDPGRRVMRSIHEAARDVARDIRKTDAYMTSFIQRRKVEMLFAHLKRYIGVPMMRLRGPKSAYEQFQLAATAQNLRKLAKLVPQPEPTS